MAKAQHGMQQWHHITNSNQYDQETINEEKEKNNGGFQPEPPNPNSLKPQKSPGRWLT